MFELEKHITVSYLYIQKFVYNYMVNSEFTSGEVAKAVNLTRIELEKRFKELTVSPRLLMAVMSFMQKEAEKMADKLKQEEDGLESNK